MREVVSSTPMQDAIENSTRLYFSDGKEHHQDPPLVAPLSGG